MAKFPTAEELFGLDGPLPPSLSTVLFKLQLSFQAEVFLRLEELNMQQKDLAKLLDVSPAAVSKMLAPGANLSLKTIAKVAAALGCDFEDLKMVPISKPRYMPLAEDKKEHDSLSMGYVVDEWMVEEENPSSESSDLSSPEQDIEQTKLIDYLSTDFAEERLLSAGSSAEQSTCSEEDREDAAA